jgi:adenylate cyclase
MEQDVAILLADLSGYTAMTNIHGGASAARIVHRYMEVVDHALYGTAKVVQRIGDQIVLISEKAEDLVSTAVSIHSLTLAEYQFLPIHAGIHYGSVFIDNGNLFGSTINIASRIMNVANRGQILCSRQVLLQLGDTTMFRSVGVHKFKNVLEEIEVFELILPFAPLSVDPVCHMHVDVSKAVHADTFNGITYYFCGVECKELFQKDPCSFVSAN